VSFWVVGDFLGRPRPRKCLMGGPRCSQLERAVMAGEAETVGSLLAQNAPGALLWQLAERYGTLPQLLPVFEATGISDGS